MKLEFSGERALIVGGSCEMGIYLAQKMIETKLHPILTFRNDSGRNRILSHMKDRYEGSFSTLLLNFSDLNTIEMIPKSAYDQLTYLVDFVEGNYESLIAGACNDSVNDYFLNNLVFRAALLKKISRAMLACKKGRMVYVSSTAAIRQNPGQGFYAASKQAAEALYRNIGLELGDRGVTTVSLRAGYVNSGRGKKYLLNNINEPLNRKLLKIEHVTETILFLLSDSAEGFNAIELVMDRGLTSGK